MSKKETRYRELLEKLKNGREEEKHILQEMDFLWQTMSLDERRDVEEKHVTWPPPGRG